MADDWGASVDEQEQGLTETVSTVKLQMAQTPGQVLSLCSVFPIINIIVIKQASYLYYDVSFKHPEHVLIGNH